MPPRVRLSIFPSLSSFSNTYTVVGRCHRCLIYTSNSQKQQQNSPSSLPRIPNPTPLVPNAATFLSLIGRGLSRHASKFTSWEHLFTVSSPELEQLGIPDARTRRYLLHWRDKFRRGDYGIGGDLQHVKDGVAELRVVSVPRLKNPGTGEAGEVDQYASIATPPGTRQLVVNLPRGAASYEGPPEELRKPAGFQLHQGRKVKGPYVKAVGGTGGTVGLFTITEGMWEHKRGQKVDGGERRKAEVRAKRRLEERRKARE